MTDNILQTNFLDSVLWLHLHFSVLLSLFVLAIMPVALPNIHTFFCPVLLSMLTYFTCDSQFFLSILQCQGEWCHKLDSCPFPSGIHKWIIFYFHKNSSVLPDCLGLYESQMVLPPHTFQQPLMISIMPALWNVLPQPSLQQMYAAVIYQLLGDFLLCWMKC